MSVWGSIFILVFIGLLLISLIILATAYWGWSD